MDFKTLIRRLGGIDKVSIIFPMGPTRQLGPITYKSSQDTSVNVECRISEEFYSLDSGYKITLVSEVEGYGYEHLYQSDLLSLIEKGIARIIKHIDIADYY